MIENKSERNLNIDLAKIIALIGVIGLHTQRCWETQSLYNPIGYYLCRFSMPLFFMINGYLILNRAEFDKKYYIYKISNIIQFIFSWSVFGFLFSLFVMNESFKSSLYHFIDALRGYYVMPLWFLFTFILIYTVLVCGAFRLIKIKIKFFILLLGSVCITIHCISIFNIFKGGIFLQELIPQRFRLWTWLFYFIVGYYIRIKENDNKLKIHILVKKHKLLCITVAFFILMVAIMYQYLLCFRYIGKMNSEYLYDSPIIILYSLIIFIMLISLPLNNGVRTIVKKISVNSFGVFCVHEWLNKAFRLTQFP